VDLAVTATGSGDTLVVFVHGVLGRGGSFDRVADVLASDCRVLWYDRRGYGGSAGAAGAPAAINGHIDVGGKSAR
jgi:pimeloyl-ACP methyl ester carboxylesterase